MRLSFTILWTLLVLALTATCALTAPIHTAAAKGDLAKVKALLKASPTLVNLADKDGATPLHHAVAGGHKAMVDLLLASRADVNAKRKNGVTPLHVAAALGRAEIVKSLLEAGAKKDATDATGRTPVSLAEQSGIAAVFAAPEAAAGNAQSSGGDGGLPLAIGPAAEITLEQYGALRASFTEISPDGAWKVPSFIAGSTDGRAQAIRLSDNTVLTLPKENFYCLRQGYGFWSRDSALLSSSEEGSLLRYDLGKGTEPVSLIPAGQKWKYASVSPDGKWVAYQNPAGNLTVADLADPRRRCDTQIRVSTIAPDSINVNKLFWSNDGSVVLVAGDKAGPAGSTHRIQQKVPIRQVGPSP